MWVRRIAALVLAAGLVAVAFVVRDRRSGGGTDAGPGTSAGPTTPGGTNPSGTFTLVCASELRAACDAAALGAKVTVRVESAGTTAAALATAADPRTVLDAWLTVDPWPAIVDGRRLAGGLGGIFGADTAPLAHSPVGVAVRTPRDQPLAAACGGAVTLACAVDKGGTVWSTIGGQVPWRNVRPAVTDASASATGLAALTAAVREQRKDTGLTLTELQDDPSFRAWLGKLEKGDAGKGSALAQSVGIPLYDAVLVPQAEFASTPGAANVFTFTGASGYEATVVLARRPSAGGPGSLAGTLTAGLQKNGWTTGAPASGAIEASLVAGIQRIWEETT